MIRVAGTIALAGNGCGNRHSYTLFDAKFSQHYNCLMSARDIIHEPVRMALINDDWQITDDPLVLRYGGRVAKADLGAERLIGATCDNRKIAVEIKTFQQKSAFMELEEALGQYIVYVSFLQQLDPDREVYLAISEFTYTTLFQEEAFQMLIQHNGVRLLIVNIGREEIVEWID